MNPKIEEYQSKLGEIVPKKVLERFYGFELEKIKEQKGKTTPDYRFVKDGQVIAMAEVKSCVDTISSEDFDAGTTFEEMSQISKKRDKNHRDKLKRHHPKAISQLSESDGLPKIIIFVSFDMTDHIDMLQMLNEHKELFPDAPLADLYILIKIHQDIEPSDAFKLTDMVRVAYDSDTGRAFAEKYLSLEEALQNAGILPMTFKV